MRRLALVLSTALALLAAVEATAEERVFRIEHRNARDAAAVVTPILSPDGSLLIEPKANTVTVRDSVAVLSRVASTLAAWDRVPGSYRVHLRVVLASKAALSPGEKPQLLPGLGADLSVLFHYTSYQELDALDLVASDGASVESSVGSRYAVRFTLRSVPAAAERLQLAGMEFMRREPGAGPSGTERLRPMLRSTVSLQLGQTVVLAVAPSERAERALLLVVTAEHEGRQ